MKSILVIDDDRSILKNLEFAFKTKKIKTFTADTGKLGLRLAKQENPDVIFLDYKLPDQDGLKMISALLKENPQQIIVMITGSATLDVAVNAIKLGAYDFMEKPFDIDKIFAILKKVEKQKNNQEKVALLENKVKSTEDSFVGQSPEIEKIKTVIKKVVKNPNFTILISGESGTGKEVLVRYIHENSLYVDKPLVDINCSAIPDNLLEAELFGYEKGAFTDAQTSKQGLFELANNGIIFLDEIGDMNTGLQTKLLRVLENHEIRRVGGTETIPLNISIVAATNKDLPKLIAEGKFREDLYYRLNIIPLSLPPLRDRKIDLEPLIDYFIARFNNIFHKEIKGISPAALQIFKNYSFPGNIRELKNILERAMLLEQTNKLTAENLVYLEGSAKPPASAQDELEYDFKEYQENVLGKVERSYFEKLLKKYKGNVSKAAEHAGIMVPSLSRILKRLGIKSGDYK